MSNSKENNRVPAIRFKGFTDPWEQRKLGDLVEVNGGRDYRHLSVGPIPVYGTGGIIAGVNESLEDSRRAIGIGRKGTIDSPARLEPPFWTVDTLFYCTLQPRMVLDYEFVYGIFQKIDWKSLDESTGVPSLSKAAIVSQMVAAGYSAEQRKVGSLLVSLDRLITLHQWHMRMEYVEG